MKNKLLNIAYKAGIDKSIFWSIVNRGLGIVRAPITIFCIVQYLTVEEQGTWYTFTSLSAISMLADLGFASITTHFISHEYAHLRFEGNKIVGDEKRLDRFIAFIYFSVKFYRGISLIAIVILIGAGFWYFSTADSEILIAWILYSFVGGAGLLVAMFQAIYQGLNKVKEIHINILINSLLVTTITCLMLSFGFKMWALVLGTFLGSSLAAIGLFQMGKQFWKQIYSYQIKYIYNFFNETLELQLRYAVSFIASYLIGFLYVPAIYKFVNAEEAGKVGLVISIVTVISSIAYSWTQTKVPTFNMLVSQKKIGELNQLIKNATIQSTFVYITLSVLMLIIISLSSNTFLNRYTNRLPDISIIILYICSQLLNIFINSLTLYLRAFKKEPLMIVQILNSIFLLFAIVLVLKAGFGIRTFLICVNLYSWCIIAPFSYYVFQKNRKLLTQN